MSDLLSSVSSPEKNIDENNAGRKNVVDFSVSDISQAIKTTLETRFAHIRVRGEISQPRFPGSGHCYLSLKDDKAVLASVIWRGQLSKLDIRPEEGMEVIAQGRITSFPGQSKYQLVIDSLELAGQGALLKQLEERRKRLLAEGLFAADIKKKLPFLPQTIGVVTSPTGAVIRDILHRLADRFPRHVLVWPVRVQGSGAAAEISAAITGFSQLPTRNELRQRQQQGEDITSCVARPDLIIVARGGGSLEDLWAFNEENTVRAAAACPIPLISAVGHETDVTLIDYAADQRAPTPSAAAEMAVPVRRDLWRQCQQLGQRGQAAIMRQGQEYHTRLTAIARGLGNPHRQLEEARQKLDMIEGRAHQAMQYRVTRLSEHVQRLHPMHPTQTVARADQDAKAMRHRLQQALQHYLQNAKARLRASHLPRPQIQAYQHHLSYLPDLEHVMRQRIARQSQILVDIERLLKSYSHKEVLARGYALIWDEAGQPISRIADLVEKQAVTIELQDGQHTIPVIEDTSCLDVLKKDISDRTLKKQKRVSRTLPKSKIEKPRPDKQGDLF